MIGVCINIITVKTILTCNRYLVSECRSAVILRGEPIDESEFAPEQCARSCDRLCDWLCDRLRYRAVQRREAGEAARGERCCRCGCLRVPGAQSPRHARVHLRGGHGAGEVAAGGRVATHPRRGLVAGVAGVVGVAGAHELVADVEILVGGGVDEVHVQRALRVVERGEAGDEARVAHEVQEVRGGGARPLAAARAGPHAGEPGPQRLRGQPGPAPRQGAERGGGARLDGAVVDVAHLHGVGVEHLHDEGAMPVTLVHAGAVVADEHGAALEAPLPPGAALVVLPAHTKGERLYLSNHFK